MFKGFTPNTIDFLWALRFNNNRPWFKEHKKEYEEHLYRPMLALADEVREKYTLEGTILKTSRIYRDVRYSNGIPYKEHLWFCIREDNVFWSEHPSMYFQIEPEGGSCGFIFYAPKAFLMEQHRKQMQKDPRVFLDILEPILADQRFKNMSTNYKRLKADCPQGLEQWYNMKNCFIEWEIPVGEELFSEKLPDLLSDAFRTLEPLYHYFRKLETIPEE